MTVCASSGNGRLETVGEMSMVRIALANIRRGESREEAVELAVAAIAEAGRAGARVVCFPECYIPGYRWPQMEMLPPDPVFLASAWNRCAVAARDAGVTVVLGTERVLDAGPVLTALVIHDDGTIAGWQDKVQLDPSEESIYVPGSGRQVFQAGPLTFGVAICHEAFRYPETVRWPAQHGAHVVFHPHADIAKPGSYPPTTFLDPANTFHEKAMLCRAAENTCYFASVNNASVGSGTTSAVIRPDGSVECWQPYGVEGLLLADLDLSLATGLLASRLRS